MKGSIEYQSFILAFFKLTPPMKSLPDIAIRMPNKSLSSILLVLHITLRFAPSGSIFAKKGNKRADS